jgi:predicted ATP-grasp superfamily ATP-dependent carboligase
VTRGSPRGSIEVLVTGANSRAGLAVARSLARHGISFLVVGDAPDSLAFRSRHVKNALVSPSPLDQPDRFFDFTLEIVKRYGIRLIIPAMEETVLIFDRYREELERHARLAMASSPALRAVLDKRKNLELAESLGIPCPRQYQLQDPGQIPDMIRSLGLPIVLKPPGSRYDPALPSFPFKVLYAHGEAQLRSYLAAYCSHGAFPIFQECASGELHNLCCFAAKGEVLAIHQYQSIRRLRGVGVLREVVKPISATEEGARRMLRALKWDGVAHVSFFVHRDSDRLWYMETNGRFWQSVQGSINAGWDFPYWVYEYFGSGQEPRPGAIRVGSRTCWHRGDLASLIIYLAGGEAPATGTSPGALRAILQYLSGFNPAITADVFQWGDPLPAVVDHWQLLKQVVQVLRSRERKSPKYMSSPTGSGRV